MEATGNCAGLAHGMVGTHRSISAILRQTMPTDSCFSYGVPGIARAR
jgi:hypothetical protein